MKQETINSIQEMITKISKMESELGAMREKLTDIMVECTLAPREVQPKFEEDMEKVFGVKKNDYKKTNQEFTDCLNVLGTNNQNSSEEVQAAMEKIQQLMDENLLSAPQRKTAEMFLKNREKSLKGVKMNFSKQQPKSEVNTCNVAGVKNPYVYNEWTKMYKLIHTKIYRDKVEVSAAEAERYLKLFDQLIQTTTEEFPYKKYLIFGEDIHLRCLSIVESQNTVPF